MPIDIHAPAATEATLAGRATHAARYSRKDSRSVALAQLRSVSPLTS
jgi:hypothetical protein